MLGHTTWFPLNLFIQQCFQRHGRPLYAQHSLPLEATEALLLESWAFNLLPVHLSGLELASGTRFETNMIVLFFAVLFLDFYHFHFLFFSVLTQYDVGALKEQSLSEKKTKGRSDLRSFSQHCVKCINQNRHVINTFVYSVNKKFKHCKQSNFLVHNLVATFFLFVRLKSW